MGMRSKKITSITLDPELLAEIDRFAETMAATRSWAIATLARAALPVEHTADAAHASSTETD